MTCLWQWLSGVTSRLKEPSAKRHCQIVHQQMHTVVFPVELYQFGLEVLAHVAEYCTQIVYHLFGEYATTAFGHENQMHMH